MTETEWCGSVEPAAMLGALFGKASERKVLLFAVACCRRVWQMAEEEPLWRPVLVAAEDFADGWIVWDTLWSEYFAIATRRFRPTSFFDELAELLIRLTSEGKERPQRSSVEWDRLGSRAYWIRTVHAPLLAVIGEAQTIARGFRQGLEERFQAALLRDIICNPFRAVDWDPTCLTWHHGVIPKLAETIYADRAFDRLPILADALEEAGCSNAAILGHCRQPGEHVRGCWVVDLLLRKE